MKILDRQRMIPHFLMFGLVPFLIVLLTCSGLVGIKFLPENMEQKKDTWLTPYKNNLRHHSIDTDVSPPYKILWDKKYKSVVTDHPLALQDYIIMTLKNGDIAFFNSKNGKKLGDGRIAPAFEHSPTIDQNVMYYGTSLGHETLIAFNLNTLKKIWKTRLPHIYTSPLVWNERVYAGTNFGQLFCIDQATGDKKWHFPAKAGLYGVIAEEKGRLFFTDIKGTVYCIDGLTGVKIWIKDLQPNIYSGPVLAENKVLVGNTAGKFYALDAQTGNIIWYTETNGSIYGNAAYKDGIIYVGNNNHYLIAIETTQGEILWKFPTKGIINTAPLVGNEYVYCGSWDKTLYTLSRKTGEKMGEFVLDKPIKSSPIIYQENVYIHTANDHLYCLTSADKPKS